MDLTLRVREEIVVALRTAAALPGSPVPAAKIFGMMQPPDTAYPFVRYGVPDTSPFGGACINGSSIAVTLHAFADGKSEDQAAAIAAWIVDVLDDTVLQLGDDNTATISWTGGSILPDPTEPDIWHAYREFDIDAVA